MKRYNESLVAELKARNFGERVTIYGIPFEHFREVITEIETETNFRADELLSKLARLRSEAKSYREALGNIVAGDTYYPDGQLGILAQIAKKALSGPGESG